MILRLCIVLLVLFVLFIFRFLCGRWGKGGCSCVEFFSSSISLSRNRNCLRFFVLRVALESFAHNDRARLSPSMSFLSSLFGASPR